MAEIRSATGPGNRETKIAKHSKTLEDIKEQLDKMMAELTGIKRIVQRIAEDLGR
jgi:archaellum component FlaC